jgi:hypothetical protein
MVRSARLVNLILTGMLTGNEFGGWIGVHPALGSLSASEHIRAEQAVYRRYGKIMPFFMTSAIASAVPVLSMSRDRESPDFLFTLSGMACLVAMLLITLAGNVPINRRLVDLPPHEASYEEFLELRKRWDRLHTVRNLLNIAGLCFSCLGSLSQPGPGDAT